MFLFLLVKRVFHVKELSKVLLKPTELKNLILLFSKELIQDLNVLKELKELKELKKPWKELLSE